MKISVWDSDYLKGPENRLFERWAGLLLDAAYDVVPGYKKPWYHKGELNIGFAVDFQDEDAAGFAWSTENKKEYWIYIRKQPLENRPLIVGNTLPHEIIHVMQMASGKLNIYTRLFNGVDMANIPYENQPYEIEAYEYSMAVYELALSRVKLTDVDHMIKWMKGDIL